MKQLKFVAKFLLELLIAAPSRARYFLPSFLLYFLYSSWDPSVICDVWSMCTRVHLDTEAACNFIQLWELMTKTNGSSRNWAFSRARTCNRNSEKEKSKKEGKNLRSTVMRMYELYVTARTCFHVTLHVALRFLQRTVICEDLENEETRDFNYSTPNMSL